MDGDSAEHKPKVEGKVINLVVKDQSGGEVFFKVKTHIKLQKVIDAYCQKKSVATSSVKFLYDGTRIQPTDTPEDLGMEDNDSIDCMIEMIGGC